MMFRKHLWWLVAALLVFTGLGAASLDDLLWVDEVFSIGNIGGYTGSPYTPAQVWQSLSTNSPQHVPGYFFLLSGWAALVGWQPLGLRALSLFFSVLTIAWTYRVGVDWAGRRVGLYGALTLSTGAFFIYYAHELRMYSLIAFLSIFVTWVYWRIAHKTGSVALWEWAALALGALALLYTHLFGALPLATIGLYHLLFVRKNRRWWVVVALLGLVGLSLLPWVQVLTQGVRNIGLDEDPLPPLVTLRELVVLFSSGNILELALLAGLGLIVWRQRGARTAWFFLIVMFILTLVANEIRPMVSQGRTRYLIHLWPFLGLVVGLGLTRLDRYRGLSAALLGVWLLVGVAQTVNPAFLTDLDGPRYTRDYPPLRAIITEVNARATADDLVIGFSRQWHVFNLLRFFTIGQFYFEDMVAADHFITLPEVRPPEQIQADLQAALDTRLTVWWAVEPQIPPAELQRYQDILEARYTLCDTPVNRADLQLKRYQLTAIGCVDPEPPATALLDYAAGVQLRDLRVQVGDDLLVAAGWDVGPQIPLNTYSVSLKLWNADGEFVAQADYGLRNAVGYSWQLAALPLADIPPGEYTLTVAVYNWSTGERLIGAGGRAEGDELPVATVQVN